MSHKPTGFTDWVNVKTFGAVGSGAVTFGDITATTAALSCTAGTFTAANVGATIMVAGAGASGADLWTTILSFTDSAHVTLNANASTSVTDVAVIFGMVDDTAAIQAAINSITTSINFDEIVLYIPAGVYMISTPLDLSGVTHVSSPAGFYGAGPESTHFIASQANTSGTIALFNATNSPWITSLRDFGVFGHTLPTGSTPANGAEVGLWVENTLVSDVWVNQTSFRYGFHCRMTNGTITRCNDFTSVFFAELDGAVCSDCSAVAYLCGSNYADAYTNAGSETGIMMDCIAESVATTANTFITAGFFFDRLVSNEQRFVFWRCIASAEAGSSIVQGFNVNSADLTSCIGEVNGVSVADQFVLGSSCNTLYCYTNPPTLVPVINNGLSPVSVAATLQKAEAGVDPNVLTYTPPAVAGSYRVRFVLSASGASAAILGWTATWTDSNGNAQAPTNLALTQSGTAAPALTFNQTGAGNFYGCVDIDVNNSATPIVVQFTLTGGTIAALVSATIERL